MSEIKKWDNNIYEFDVTKASRELNPWLANYGKDRFTFSPETTYTSAAYLQRNEASFSHGYPLTAWLQLALVYDCGLYTAKEQGIVKKKVFFQRFWRAHYFDWLLFARRGLIYGVAGGLVIGTLAFGDHVLALRRAHSKYQHYFLMQNIDPKQREVLILVNPN